MKITRQLAVIAALGMLAFATSNTQAVPLTLSISGSATQQDAATVKNGVTNLTTTKVSVGTQDILQDLATIKGFGALPDGATLVYNPDDTTTNKFAILNKDGSVWHGVASSFAFTRAEGQVTTGKVGPAAGQESTTDTFVGTFTYNPGNGNIFTIIGLATDKFSQSAPKNDVVSVSETISLSGSGPAHIDGTSGTATGKVSGKGSSK